ncbi:sarcosine oxidase subunit beta [Haloarcula vallismortis]|uniref:Sarcosine oxidase n=2 Tax=Haloarcula vallismortis TaxID=28442 RepID=M0JGL6_HALVA|nr:FAD-dependent oxidoreductase [Haloarcula vallismortis]EMA06835.1 sarcosine oxidase [Haloarcula vallismortis ATCC 29715]SDW66813.1 sarcosine oxidase subunit beta [Haloarcula vallismortis]
MNVAVVGGGAVGLSTATALARRGASVTVFERDTLGSGASGRAAGLCYDAFADDVDAAVATHALARYRDMDLFEPQPYVWVARDESDATAVREQISGMQRNGVAVEALTPAALGDRYPALCISSIEVAGLARDAGVLDPDEVVATLAEQARADGATVETETPVSLASPTTVETPSEARAFDAVVVAAGPQTKPLVADIGVSLALKAYRAQALVTGPVDAELPSFYDATREFYWRPKDDALLVGNGAHEVDPADWNPDADAEFVTRSLDRVEQTSALTPACDRAWAGLCTATPDGAPLAGPVADGLWVATGWQGHGLMRAPAMGDYLAAAVLDRPNPLSEHLPDRVDPTRFDGSETFAALEDPTRDWVQ